MRRPHRSSFAVIALIAFAAGCGSGGGTGVTTTPGSITLSVTPTSATIQQGGSTQVTGTIIRTNFTGDVTVSVTGAPSGVSGSATLQPVNGGNTAQVTLTTLGSTATGTYTLTVIASGSGISNATATFTLTITATTPASYTMTLGTPSPSIAQGGTAPSTLTFVRTEFTGEITLTAENLPTGITAAFATNPVTGTSSSVTFTATSTAAPGTFSTILIRGTAPGLTDVTASVTLTVTVTGSFTIAAGNASVNVTQGSNVTTSINATRAGGFAGTIVYTITGPSNAPLPTGLTAAVTPTGTADQNTLTVTTTAALPVATYPIVVHGTAFGSEQTASLNVVVAVAGSFTIAAGHNSLNVVRGNNVTTSINATRLGGFAGTITYTVTGPSNGALPTGLTAAVSPTGTADQNTLTVSTTSALGTVTYPIVVHATSPSAPEQDANINVVVAATGAPVHIDFSACDPTTMPIWLAYQDGSGAFTHVVGTGNVYNFSIGSGSGAVATVTQAGTTNFFTTVIYLSQAEFGAVGSGCTTAVTGKTINGSVTGMTTGNIASMALGGARITVASANPNFQLTNVASGLQDLIAYLDLTLQNETTNDRVLIRRDLNLSDGSTLTPALNFATEGAPVATGTITVTGAATNSFTVTTNYLTGTSCPSEELNNPPNLVTSPYTAYGVPPVLQRVTDFHNLVISQVGGPSPTDMRTVSTSFNLMASKSIAIGAGITPVTLTTLSGGFKRVQAQFPLSSDYNSVTMSYTSGNNGIFLSQSAAYLGAVSSVTIAPPDLTTVSGYLGSWGPSGAYNYAIGASSTVPATMCAEGATLRTARSTGNGS